MEKTAIEGVSYCGACESYDLDCRGGAEYNDRSCSYFKPFVPDSIPEPTTEDHDEE